jgi:hypothetical protein
MLTMEDEGSHSGEKLQLDEYKAMETRLYGELVKSCQSYSVKLSIISIVGILDLVTQEIKDLEKEKFKFMKEDFPEE